MRCTVWRSSKKNGAYVYLPEGDIPEVLPPELTTLLGRCVEVMSLDLSQRQQLASEDIATVRSNLLTQGYHLQMPPQPYNPLQSRR